MSRIFYDTSNANSLHTVYRHQDQLGIMKAHHFGNHVLRFFLIRIYFTQTSKAVLGPHRFYIKPYLLDNFSVAFVIGTIQKL